MSRQMDMQLFLADGCKEALLEEKRRFCFLVDKHCMFSYQTASFHDKVQSAEKIGSVQRSSDFIFRSLGRRNLLCYHGDGKNFCADLTRFSFIVFPAGTGQRHSDGEAEQLAGPVHRCHRNARQRADDDRGAAHHRPHRTPTLPLPVTPQRGMRRTVPGPLFRTGSSDQRSFSALVWSG